MIKRFRVFAVSICAVAALAGCGDSPSLPAVTGTEGAMRFSYSGARSGTYSAVGDANDPSAAGERAFAYGGPGYTALQAYVGGSDGSRVTVYLAFPTPAGPGTVTYDQAHCLPDLFCAGGAIVFTASGNTDGWSFRRGTIRVTSVDGFRIRGTFTGELVDGSGAPPSLSVKDGRFDLPIVAAP